MGRSGSVLTLGCKHGTDVPNITLFGAPAVRSIPLEDIINRAVSNAFDPELNKFK